MPDENGPGMSRLSPCRGTRQQHHHLTIDVKAAKPGPRHAMLQWLSWICVAWADPLWEARLERLCWLECSRAVTCEAGQGELRALASLGQALASEDLERKFVGLGHFYLVLREKNFDLCRWTHALRVTEADLAERGLSVASLADAACRSPSVFGYIWTLR